jgi:hypothetical protein
MDFLVTVTNLLKSVTIECFGAQLRYRIERDVTDPIHGRVFIQVIYDAPCTKTGNLEEWKGRKWYLTEFMLEDEIIKTAYVAFEAAVKHEIMEGFKFDGQIVFNPHVSFRDLLTLTHKEIKREQIKQ